MRLILTFLLLVIMSLSGETQNTLVNAEEPKLTKVIAHRGASYEAPENTKAAILLAIEKGASVVEFDVMHSKDGSLFLFHDANLKRICGRNEKLSDLTDEQVAQLDVGTWFKKSSYPNESPLALTDAIQLCREHNVVPLIEHKTGTPESYAQVFKDLDVVDQVIVQSFKWDFIRSLREILPTLKIGALGSKSLSKHKTALAELAPDWVGWKNQDTRQADIQWLKDKDIKVAIWTVNDPIEATRLLNWGADRVITDRPAYVEKIILSELSTSGK